MSSVHRWNDNRIFIKQAVSLARRYQVELHAVGGPDAGRENGVKIVGLPAIKRFFRPINWMRLFWRAVKARADIYHFHDPELIPLGLVLKTLGFRVVYDIHEDYSDAIRHKHWIPGFLRGAVARAFDRLEKKCCRFFDALVFAELAYKESFREVPVLKEDILNYPPANLPAVVRERDEGAQIELVYAGTISEIRGALQMIEVLHLLREDGVNACLRLVGPVFEPGLAERIDLAVGEYGLSGFVSMTGRVPPLRVYEFMARADIGLALLHPVENNLKSLVTKLFEYMASGLAIVASDFPRWRDLFRDTGTGVTADPLNPGAIVAAIKLLANDPELRKQMGRCGRVAYEKRFNWAHEEQKLLRLYDNLLFPNIAGARKRAENS